MKLTYFIFFILIISSVTGLREIQQSGLPKDNYHYYINNTYLNATLNFNTYTNSTSPLLTQMWDYQNKLIVNKSIIPNSNTLTLGNTTANFSYGYINQIKSKSITADSVTASLFQAGEIGEFQGGAGYFSDLGVYTNSIQTTTGDLTIRNLDDIYAGSSKTLKIRNSLEVRGNLTVSAGGSFTIPRVTSIVECNVSNVGRLSLYKQFVTQADTLLICVGINQTAYQWKNITLG